QSTPAPAAGRPEERTLPRPAPHRTANRQSAGLDTCTSAPPTRPRTTLAGTTPSMSEEPREEVQALIPLNDSHRECTEGLGRRSLRSAATPVVADGVDPGQHLEELRWRGVERGAGDPQRVVTEAG